MYILGIFKREKRRSGIDRRKANAHQYTAQERRKNSDRRSKKDRRKDVGRRSGIYYKLPDRRKDTVDDIVKILEYENLKKK
jgi:hypothetical protein